MPSKACAVDASTICNEAQAPHRKGWCCRLMPRKMLTVNGKAMVFIPTENGFLHCNAHDDDAKAPLWRRTPRGVRTYGRWCTDVFHVVCDRLPAGNRPSEDISWTSATMYWQKEGCGQGKDFVGLPGAMDVLLLQEQRA